MKYFKITTKRPKPTKNKNESFTTEFNVNSIPR